MGQKRRQSRRYAIRCTRTMVVLLFVGLMTVVPSAMATGGSGQWFQVGTARGTIEGYGWSAGAKGIKGKQVGRVCSELSIVEPPREGAPYVEGQDATDCGELKSLSDSVEANVSYGSGASLVGALQVLYRPGIKKVNIVLGSGRRMSLRPHIYRDSSTAAAGIPAFRYLVVPLEAGDLCVKRLTAFDGRGRIASKQNRPPCGRP